MQPEILQSSTIGSPIGGSMVPPSYEKIFEAGNVQIYAASVNYKHYDVSSAADNVILLIFTN
jgi:hypothetical protein